MVTRAPTARPSAAVGDAGASSAAGDAGAASSSAAGDLGGRPRFFFGAGAAAASSSSARGLFDALRPPMRASPSFDRRILSRPEGSA